MIASTADDKSAVKLDTNTTNFVEHKSDFDKLYERVLAHGDDGIRFPLNDIDGYDVNRGVNANEYYAYMYRRFTCHILQKMELEDGMDILVIGSGFGWDEKNIKKLYPNSSIWSIDISTQMLNRAKNSKSPSNFIMAVAEKLPFPDKCFDRIVSREVIEHVLDPQAMMTEVHRVLKPGGRAVITTENEESWALNNEKYEVLKKKLKKLLFIPEKPEGPSAYKDDAPSLEEFKEISTSAGLELVDYFWDGALYKALPVFQHILGKTKTVMLAHYLSALENNRKLAFLFCDQVKYVVIRPAEISTDCNPVCVTRPGTNEKLERVEDGYIDELLSHKYNDVDGIPNLIPLVDKTVENSEDVTEGKVSTKAKSSLNLRLIKWGRFSYRAALLAIALLCRVFVSSNKKSISKFLQDSSYKDYIKLSLE